MRTTFQLAHVDNKANLLTHHILAPLVHMEVPQHLLTLTKSTFHCSGPLEWMAHNDSTLVTLHINFYATLNQIYTMHLCKNT